MSDDCGDIRIEPAAFGSIVTEHRKEISVLRFSPNGQFLASASADRQIFLWSKGGNEGDGDGKWAPATKKPFRGHAKGISDLAWSPDSRYIASASDDCTVMIWAAANAVSALGKDDHHVNAQMEIDHSMRIKKDDHSSRQENAQIKSENSSSDSNENPNSNSIVINQSSNDVNQSKVTNYLEQPVRIFKGHESVVFCVAFSPLGTVLASGSFDESIRLWDVKNERCIRVIAAHSDPITSVAFNNDGSLLASSSFDGLIRVWRVDSGQCLKTLIDDDNPPVSLVKFTPNGKYLLAWSLDSCIRLWDFMHQLGKCVRQYQGHLNAKYCCTGDLFQSFQEGFVVTGGEDGKISLWKLQEAKLVAQIASPAKQGESPEERAVLALAVNAQSGEIVSCSLSLPFALDFWCIKRQEQ